jgi:hypothetical protein
MQAVVAHAALEARERREEAAVRVHAPYVSGLICNASAYLCVCVCVCVCV